MDCEDWGRNAIFCGDQGLHRLEKYLNIQDCLEKSLKFKIFLEKYLKNTKRPGKVLEYYHLQEDSTLSSETQISIKLRCLYLVQHMLHQIKAPQFYTNFLF